MANAAVHKCRIRRPDKNGKVVVVVAQVPKTAGAPTAAACCWSQLSPTQFEMTLFVPMNRELN